MMQLSSALLRKQALAINPTGAKRIESRSSVSGASEECSGSDEQTRRVASRQLVSALRGSLLSLQHGPPPGHGSART